MKQEDKDLLFKDLSSRLPYGVKCEVYNRIGVLDEISSYGAAVNYDNGEDTTSRIEYVKPYLFPLSNIIEEQRKELEDMGWSFDDSVINNIVEYLGNHRQFVTHFDCFALIDWLNKNHFDFRGLIEKGLALDATGLNIY